MAHNRRGIPALNPEPFSARRLTGYEMNRRTWNSELLGDKLDELLIRGPVDQCGPNADLDFRSVEANDLGARGTRLYVDLKRLGMRH